MRSTFLRRPPPCLCPPRPPLYPPESRCKVTRVELRYYGARCDVVAVAPCLFIPRVNVHEYTRCPLCIIPLRAAFHSDGDTANPMSRGVDVPSAGMSLRERDHITYVCRKLPILHLHFCNARVQVELLSGRLIAIGIRIDNIP